MKTTLDISDPILDRLRARAARDGTSMKTLVNAALRQFLGASGGPRPKKFKLRDASVKGNGLAPGIREGDWEQIRDIIYEGRGGSPQP